MVRIQVPATSANLGPGFDVLGVALDLYNYVYIEEMPGLDIKVCGEGKDQISCGEDNIVYRAAQAVYLRVGLEPSGFRIVLENNIPVARGLGSSAAAIAGGLVGANALLGNPLNLEELISMAVRLEGHPDNVVAAMVGGFIVAARCEETICYKRLDPPKSLHFQVAVPDFTLLTEAARYVLPQAVSLKDAVFNLGKTALLVAALASGDLETMGRAMDDRLHQPFRIDLVPGIQEVFAVAKESGALGVALSGSGPTVIALSDRSCSQVGLAMQKAFEKHGILSNVMELTVSQTGAVQLE